MLFCIFFFFNDPATTEIYTLSLHDALPIFLYALKRFFRCGVVRRNHEDRYELRIRKFSCLQEVVAFFEKHPLKTKKQVDFRKFAKVIRRMAEKRHLTTEGLIEIIEITLSMNRADKQKAKEILQVLQQSG